MNRNPVVAVQVDPELRYPDPGDLATAPDTGRPVYAAVAEIVAKLGLPGLAGLVEPGDRVVIKPDWIFDQHPAGDEAIFGNITHGAVLCALADMALAQAGPDGEVIVAEITTEEANFARMCAVTGMWRAAAHLEARHDHAIEIMDLRSAVADRDPDGGVRRRSPAPGLADDGYPFGDPLGYADVDLAELSEHAARDVAGRLGATGYAFSPGPPAGPTQPSPGGPAAGRHIYQVPRLFLSADVIISVPKLKTHLMTGIAGALQSPTGINARAAMSPGPGIGPAMANGKTSPAGAEAGWYGDDVLWRTILDLNKILRYGLASGELAGKPQRRYLTVLDGIEASDGPGPIHGRRRQAGALIAGTDPVCVDTVAATLMGFEWRALPHVARAYGLAPRIRLTDARPEEIVVRARPRRYEAWGQLTRAGTLAFAAPPGWATRIELS